MILIATARHGSDDDSIMLLETTGTKPGISPEKLWDMALASAANRLYGEEDPDYENYQGDDETPSVDACFDYLSDYDDKEAVELLASCGLRHVPQSYLLTHTGGDDRPLEW